MVPDKEVAPIIRIEKSEGRFLTAVSQRHPTGHSWVDQGGCLNGICTLWQGGRILLRNIDILAERTTMSFCRNRAIHLLPIPSDANTINAWRVRKILDRIVLATGARADDTMESCG